MATRIGGVTCPVLKNGNEGYTSLFGWRVDPITKVPNSFHYGIDIQHVPNKGDDIIAFAAGKVTIAKDTVPGFDDKNNTAGNYIEIDHGNGFKTRYLHLKHKSVKVKVGDVVRQGQVIATMGSTGYSTGVHLHFEIWKNGSRVDPLPYLKGTERIPGSGTALLPNAPAPAGSIKKDDKVKIKPGAKAYDGKSVAAFVYNNSYPVDELSGDRALLDKKGLCTAFRVSDLVLVPAAVPPMETGPATYKVAASDTLSKIARQFGTDVDSLVRLNGIKDPNKIGVGQVLKLK